MFLDPLNTETDITGRNDAVQGEKARGYTGYESGKYDGRRADHKYG